MGGYWLGPSINTFAAAARIDSGPSRSGKPWPRLTALCSVARADMTVKMVVPCLAKTGLKAGDVLMATTFAEADWADKWLGGPPAKRANCTYSVQLQLPPLCATLTKPGKPRQMRQKSPAQVLQFR